LLYIKLLNCPLFSISSDNRKAPTVWACPFWLESR